MSAIVAPRFRYIDLFAGIGGFHAALTALGGECVYAVEIDGYAAAVYERNWGMPALGDVTTVAGEGPVSDEIPDHDVLAAGFPCQPFSKSGHQRGMDEIRGTLFFNIMKIVKARRPKVVLLENVRNLIGPRHRHEWDVIIGMLNEEGYNVSSRPAIISPHQIPAEYGGRPQTRDRVFITATRVDRGQPLTPSAVEPIRLPFEVDGVSWDISSYLLDESDARVRGTQLSAQETALIDHWDKWVQQYRLANPGRALPSFPLWESDWRDPDFLEELLGTIELRDTPTWKKNFLRKNARIYADNVAWLDDWRKGLRTITSRNSRRKLEWQAGDAESLWDCLLQFRPSGLRAKPPTYVPALVAITQTSIIGPQKRRLAVAEAARLQGLPDTFDFGDQPEAKSFKQLGNGVNVGAVWNVMKAHCERDRNLLLDSPVLGAVTDAPASPDALVLDELERIRKKREASAS